MQILMALTRYGQTGEKATSNTSVESWPALAASAWAIDASGFKKGKATSSTSWQSVIAAKPIDKPQIGGIGLGCRGEDLGA